MKILREDDETNSAIEVMLANDELQDEAYVGCFWYDRNSKQVFGVAKTLAIDVPFYDSKMFNCKLKTGRALHKSIWKKEQMRKRDRRFAQDYTTVHRGRVFEFADGTFRVYTGSWIKDCPEAKNEILDEFQLPSDTLFVQDKHWDIGHGLSDEL